MFLEGFYDDKQVPYKIQMDFLLSYSWRKTMKIFLNESVSNLFQTFCWTFLD